MSALWIARYCLAVSMVISLSGLALGMARLIDPGLSLALAVYGWAAVALSSVACLVLQIMSRKPKREKNSN